MSKFILSLDEVDHIRERDEQISFSTFIDHNEGIEIRTFIDPDMWRAYDCPANVVVEIIV